jgi:hypothetical protein
VQDPEIKTELRRLVKASKLKTGLSDLYFVLLPPGVYTCLHVRQGTCSFKSTEDICGFHGYSGKASSTIVYAVLPEAASVPVTGCDQHQRPNGNGNEGADATLNTLEHEQNEAITDPTLLGWSEGGGHEIGDKCNETFGQPLGGAPGAFFDQVVGEGNYWLQLEWSNATHGCAGQPPAAVVVYQPAQPKAGEGIAFDGSLSTAAAGSITSYAWTFGDGQSGSGRQVVHSYSALGAYWVGLTVRDTNGLTESSYREVGVAKP